MSKRGDDHVRRAHIANARKILAKPACDDLKARDRSRQVAKALGLSLRRAEEIRVAAEKQAAEEAEADVPAAAAGRERLCASLLGLVGKAELLLDSAMESNQLNAAAGAIRQLRELHLDLARWQGAKPADEIDGDAAKPAVFSFGPSDA